jgi:hypothetical protein
VIPETPCGEAAWPRTAGRTFRRRFRTWLEALVASNPPRCAGTLLELPLGTMLSDRGLLSRALLGLVPRRCWQAYYWMVERGKLRWLPLVHALRALLRREFPVARRFVIPDDTLVPRSSDQAPGAAVRFDHAHKTNRADHLLCQCLVTLSAVLTGHGRERGVPLIASLVPEAGNPSRLRLAKVLLRAIGNRLGPLTLLADAWSLKRPLVLWAVQRGIVVIGQARRDTALFALPPVPAEPRRGHPRVYGARLDAPACAASPRTEKRLACYGGAPVRWRSAVCRARFLRGLTVRAVGVSLHKAEGRTKDRLLLSTDATPSVEAIITDYSLRRSTEPMFNSLKNAEGLREPGMRRRAVLLRWLPLVQLGYALLVMLAAKADPEVLALLRIPGWRTGGAITPGLVKDALAAAFRHCEPVRLLGSTPRKIRPPKLARPPPPALAA